MVGHGEDAASCCTPAASSTTRHGVQNVPRRDQHRAGVGPDRPPKLRLRHDHRPGQRPGRPRARAEVRPASRLARHQQPGAPRVRRRRLGHRPRRSCPGPASMPTRCSARSTPARSRACSSICFNPMVSLPDSDVRHAMLEKLEFFVAIDFFLNETARYADIVLPGSLHEEDEGTVTQIEGRVIKINKAVDCPGDARQDWRIIQDIAAALGRPHGFTFDEPARDLRRAAPRVARAASPTTRASPTRRSSSRYGVFWPCSSDDPRPSRSTTPARRGCSSRASWNPIAKGAGRSTSPTARRASTSPTTAARRGRSTPSTRSS